MKRPSLPTLPSVFQDFGPPGRRVSTDFHPDVFREFCDLGASVCLSVIINEDKIHDIRCG